MNFILFLIAIAVFYYLFQSFKEYEKNPYKPKNTADKEETGTYIQKNFYEKVRDSEYGIITALLAKVARADGVVHDLEREMMRNMIDDLAKEFVRDEKEARIELEKIFKEEQKTADNTDSLSFAFLKVTNGEYKKRLKIVEFLLALGYADGGLDDSERDVIIGIAAILEISNDDFNRVYDGFEEYYKNRVNSFDSDLESAYKHLGLESTCTNDEAKAKYRELVKKYHPDILQGQGYDKDYLDIATKKMQELNDAYEVIKKQRSL